ncbi:Uncharacterised protein [Klebsiella pneumoniae]|nr:Uncharacterised protein [Klebsiella pneumoniae]
MHEWLGVIIFFAVISNVCFAHVYGFWTESKTSLGNLSFYQF